MRSGAVPFLRSFRGEDAAAVSSLAQREFQTFIARDCTAAGIEEYCRFTSAEAVRQRATEGDITLVIAASADGGDSQAVDATADIVGVAQFSTAGYLRMLFVAADWHRRGLARLLVDEGIRRVRAADPAVRRIDLRASRYAVEAYQRLGFHATSSETLLRGIPATPMSRGLPFPAEQA